ncbi:hypothetical protein Poly30_55200 [Planctomycetes bacterium Poly30]|uniref:DUF3500 domain-containing protein n=1 Tax=Saltatorellus ferox TaxID=2528018 RepID=A0A518F0W5_9BACT|nr:hypothetical protein Poly30_55200 [Planctomycetes bacterium Poly30]
MLHSPTPTQALVSRLAPGASFLSVGLLGMVAWLATLQAPAPLDPATPPQGAETGDGIARGHSMAAYTKGFLSQLDEGGRELATASMDDPERRQWAFGPVRREGIRLDQINQQQFGLLEALLDTALSESGMAAWHQIRDLENVLRKLESTPERVAEHRDPNLYWLRIYGTPDASESWSWRFEGHHLALHVTCRPGSTPTVTPLFVGANPLFGASRQGIAMSDEKPAQVEAFADLNAAFNVLIGELDDGAALAAAPEISGVGPTDRPGDVRMAPGQRELPEASGVARAQLGSAASEALDRLLTTYLELIDPELRTFSLESSPADEVHFTRWGGTTLAEPRTWSIVTKTFALELATTDGPHHVHALLRDVTRDFGGKE